MTSFHRPLGLLLTLLLAHVALGQQLVTSSQLQKGLPALPLFLFRHLRQAEQQAALDTRSAPHLSQHEQQLTFGTPAPTSYTPHYFDQLVSHDNDVPAPSPNATFRQRYWFDASAYRKGGPVFLLDGGETDGEGRLPFMKEGILQLLSEATGGISIVFEHRYYGESFPVKNLTTDSYRYLTTMQSLEDGAHFARNVKLPGLEGVDLHPDHTPWFYYGGSYAGAKAAFARKLFPDVWWGAIASSAVTTAITDFWEYYTPIQKSGPPACIQQLQNHTAAIDSLLALDNPFVTSSLKSYFGLPNITLDADFVNTLSMPLSAWQARNWDPEVGMTAFFEFCDALTTEPEGDVESSELEASLPEVIRQAFPGWPSDPRKTFASFSAYATFTEERVASLCPEGEEQDDCFGTAAYVGSGLEEAPWKSWSYQFCTEYGYYIGAPPKGNPSLVSSLLTPEYSSSICKTAFPAGELNRVPETPNITAINQWGSFELEYPRLAFIDGSEDPWLYATPHSPHAKNPSRKDTLKRPFKLIPGGVHHWDENGRLDDDVPKAIRKVHAEEIKFVKAWMKEWEGKGKWRTGPWRN